MKKIADGVYGSNIGFGKAQKLLVLKFDYGSYRRSFLASEAIAVWLYGHLSHPGGFLLGQLPTIPELNPEDWDGSLTPSITSVKTDEFNNGVVFDFTLDRGPNAVLLLDNRNWLTFADRFWQYQSFFVGGP